MLVVFRPVSRSGVCLSASSTINVSSRKARVKYIRHTMITISWPTDGNVFYKVCDAKIPFDDPCYGVPMMPLPTATSSIKSATLRSPLMTPAMGEIMAPNIPTPEGLFGGVPLRWILLSVP